MRLFRLALLAVSLPIQASLALAAEAPPMAKPTAAVPVVTTTAPREWAELSYRSFLGVQYTLHQAMPPEPHLVDLWFRVSYSGMSEAERDVHVPPRRAVALHGKSVDVAVPMRRGAYFSLPAIQDAYDEHAALVIGGTSKPWVGLWWTLRVPDSGRMSYGDIRAARAQIAAAQGRISAFSHPYLKDVKRQPYDGIKACFLDGSGAILVDGKAVADASQGHCKVLFNDPGRFPDGHGIVFSGPLDVVSFIDRSYYR